MSEPVRIPLSTRLGPPRGWALVDADDFEWLGTRPWFLTSNGYAGRNVGKGRVLLMHREILGLTHGDGLHTDHVNRDKLDNRRGNLRVCTHAENLQNVTAHRDAGSAYRGVSWAAERNCWVAQCSIRGEYHHLGYFAAEERAALAAARFRVKHMPFAVDEDRRLIAQILEQRQTEEAA